MATTTISFTFQNTDLANIEPVLCTWANLPNTPANAKAAVIIWLQQLYAASLAQATAQAAYQAAQEAAQTTANAVVIT